jgi:hypothetical protein
MAPLSPSGAIGVVPSPDTMLVLPRGFLGAYPGEDDQGQSAVEGGACLGPGTCG